MIANVVNPGSGGGEEGITFGCWLVPMVDFHLGIFLHPSYDLLVV